VEIAMSKSKKALFIKCLKAVDTDKEMNELGKIFNVKKTSLAAYKAHLTMGRY
jgi:hypothetical protein